MEKNIRHYKMEREATLFDALNKKKRLKRKYSHEPFVEIVPMTARECARKGAELKIGYDFYDTPVGEVLIASTDKGICYLGFSADRDGTVCILSSLFPQADISNRHSRIQKRALQIFQHKGRGSVKLHIRGTEFQLRVWEALLKVPLGYLTSYGAVAEFIGCPKGSRAVGQAVGSNPVSYVIPCHRVVRSDREIGGYFWGLPKKAEILAWEDVCGHCLPAHGSFR